MGQIWQNSIPYSGAGSAEYLDITGVLSAGSTILTMANNAFKDDSVVDIFTDPYGIIPKNAVISEGLISLTFKAQSFDVEVLVRIYKERGGKTYKAGKLIEITEDNKINVRMTKSTEEDIASQSSRDSNTLYYTEGTAGTIYTTYEYLNADSWTGSSGHWTQSVYVFGITSSTNVIVSPVSDSTDNFDNYCNAGIRAYFQSDNFLNFVASDKPSVTLQIVIAYWE